MADASTPPPSRTAGAAAAGGFAGAFLGVIAATALMGSGDDGNPQAAIEKASEEAVELAALNQEE